VFFFSFKKFGEKAKYFTGFSRPREEMRKK